MDERTLIRIRLDLKRAAAAEGRPEGTGPSRGFYEEWDGPFGSWIVRKAAGGMTTAEHANGLRAVPRLGWAPSLRAFGLESPGEARIAVRHEIGDDVRRVARQLGRPTEMPTEEEYDEHGAFSYATARKLGGTWEDTAQMLGLEHDPPYNHGLTREQMLRDYRAACRMAGLEPGGYGLSHRRFRHCVDYSASNVHRLFGQWNDMVRQAGYRTRPRPGRIYGEQEQAA